MRDHIANESFDRHLKRRAVAIIVGRKHAIHAADLDAATRTHHTGEQVMRRLDVIDDDVWIGLHRNAIVRIVLHDTRGRREKVMPTKRRACEVRMQCVHHFIHTKQRARIFKHDHQSHRAELILRMLHGDQALGLIDHVVDVCGFLFVLQLWHIEHQRLRVVPVRIEMQREVIEMQWKRIITEKEKRAGERKTWKALDWKRKMRGGQLVTLASASIDV